MGLRGGAQRRAAAGELPVSLLQAGGQVKEGLHQFSGAAGLLPQVVMPQLVYAVVGYDM